MRDVGPEGLESLGHKRVMAELIAETEKRTLLRDTRATWALHVAIAQGVEVEHPNRLRFEDEGSPPSSFQAIKATAIVAVTFTICLNARLELLADGRWRRGVQGSPRITPLRIPPESSWEDRRVFLREVLRPDQHSQTPIHDAMDESRRDVVREYDVSIRGPETHDLADHEGFSHSCSVEVDHTVTICTRLTYQLKAWISVRHAVDVDISRAFVVPVWLSARALEATANDLVSRRAIREMTQVRRKIIRIRDLFPCEIARNAGR